jgi:hypothetical protein
MEESYKIIIVDDNTDFLFTNGKRLGKKSISIA